MKAEILKIKEKQFKKAQVDKMRTDLDRRERELYIIQIKHSKQDVELSRLKADNLKLSTDVKYLNDTLKVQIDHKNEYKSSLESTEHFQGLQEAVNHITGMLVSQSSSELSA